MTRSEDMYCLPIEKFLGLNITSSDQSSLKKGESPFMKNFSITDTYAIKKRDGYKRSIELSREYDLYRQNYCGCSFSKR